MRIVSFRLRNVSFRLRNVLYAVYMHEVSSREECVYVDTPPCTMPDAYHTPAINECCTQSLRISHASRRAPLQPVSKTQDPCTPYHPPNIAILVWLILINRVQPSFITGVLRGWIVDSHCQPFCL
jgi:hypothetical protein